MTGGMMDDRGRRTPDTGNSHNIEPSKEIKTKLFCSFTRTLQLLHNGQVSDDDLNSGLFAFSCTRGHAFNPWATSSDPVSNEVTWIDDTKEVQQQIHSKLVSALESAERENRVIWRDDTLPSAMSLELVNRLLVSNGFDPLVELASEHYYSYPALRKLIQECGQELELAYDYERNQEL